MPDQRPPALLAYLLVSGQTHTLQHLTDLLFESPDDPRAALRWTLAKLCEAIEANYIPVQESRPDCITGCGGV
jgi:DNA-binding SARP family transcriptional activator